MNRSDIPDQRSNERQTQNQPVRVVKDDINVYYSNCAMVGTSPVDLCVYFGRFGQTLDKDQQPVMAELYDNQIYMTVAQAKRLAAVLNQTIQSMESSAETEQSPAAQQRQTRPGAQQQQRTAPAQPARPAKPGQRGPKDQ
jgi:hypothetical protein